MLSFVMRNHSVLSGNRGATRGRYYFRLRRERARAFSRLGDAERVEQELASVLGIPLEKVRALLEELDCRGVRSTPGREKPERRSAISSRPRETTRSKSSTKSSSTTRSAAWSVARSSNSGNASASSSSAGPRRSRGEPLARRPRTGHEHLARARAAARVPEQTKLRALVAAAQSPILDDWLAHTLVVGRSWVAPPAR